MIEIYSGWGNCEDTEGAMIGNGSNKYSHLTALNALKRGYKFGFVSGSDSHERATGRGRGWPTSGCPRSCRKAQRARRRKSQRRQQQPAKL